MPLVVCPTSWTPDEDFDLLLEALERAERDIARAAPSSTPTLAVILTGRGALRASFEARAARRSFKAIAVRTHWLEPADYPVLIGMADLGLMPAPVLVRTGPAHEARRLPRLPAFRWPRSITRRCWARC